MFGSLSCMRVYVGNPKLQRAILHIPERRHVIFRECRGCQENKSAGQRRPLLFLVMGSWMHEPVPAIQLVTYDRICCAWCHLSTYSLCNASTSSAVIESQIQVKGNRCPLASFDTTCQQGNQSLLRDLPQHFRFMVSAEF